MKLGCVSNQVQSAYDLISSLPQYLWVGTTESHDQSLSGMLMLGFGGKHQFTSPFYLGGWSLAQIPWKYLQSGSRCGESLVSTNPLIFNGICFNIAFPMGNDFISLLLRVSLFFCRLNYFIDSFSGYPLLEELVVLKGPYFVFVSTATQALSPQILLANWMSLGMMVTRLA